MGSRLAHPEIREAWQRFIEVAKAHYGKGEDEELDLPDLEALRGLDHLINPLVRYDGDGVVKLDGVQEDGW